MFDPDPNRDPSKPSPARIGIWVVVGAVALYLIFTGVSGILGLNG